LSGDSGVEDDELQLQVTNMGPKFWVSGHPRNLQWLRHWIWIP